MPKKNPAKKRSSKKVKKSTRKVAAPPAATSKAVETAASKEMSPEEINQAHLLATLKELTSLAESGAIGGLVYIADGHSPKRGWSGNINASNIMLPIEMTKFEITTIAINHARNQQAVEQPST